MGFQLPVRNVKEEWKVHSQKGDYNKEQPKKVEKDKMHLVKIQDHWNKGA